MLFDFVFKLNNFKWFEIKVFLFLWWECYDIWGVVLCRVIVGFGDSLGDFGLVNCFLL